MQLYEKTGKPIMVQHVADHEKYQEKADERKKSPPMEEGIKGDRTGHIQS